MKTDKHKPTRTISDTNGNSILVFNNGANIDIKLKLKTETRERKIGTINIQSKTFIVKRKRAKHLHRVSNSYGFNAFVINEAKKFDTVRLIDEYNTYNIPVKTIIENGKYLFFQQQGFEKQLFVHISVIEKYEAKRIGGVGI